MSGDSPSKETAGNTPAVFHARGQPCRGCRNKAVFPRPAEPRHFLHGGRSAEAWGLRLRGGPSFSGGACGSRSFMPVYFQATAQCAFLFPRAGRHGACFAECLPVEKEAGQSAECLPRLLRCGAPGFHHLRSQTVGLTPRCAARIKAPGEQIAPRRAENDGGRKHNVPAFFSEPVWLPADD